MPNWKQLQRLIVNGYRSLYRVNETFFEGVTELPSGSVLTLRGNTESHPERYWHPQITRNNSLTFGEAVERCRHTVIEAVRLRLRADVPLAFCMSGGIDSNTLNIIYNLADFVNKLAFGLVIWAAAMQNTSLSKR
ncbi:asparagine synthase-related protein [Croceibacter atlanticus]|uniref:asparagine synthase-related protein n=1 Tax=Croceibacter atlanticus TaxID=313588 RepID=UPI0032B17411